MDLRSKRLAFESSINQVRFLLNRSDLDRWEKSSIEMAILELEDLIEMFDARNRPADSAEQTPQGIAPAPDPHNNYGSGNK